MLSWLYFFILRLKQLVLYLEYDLMCPGQFRSNYVSVHWKTRRNYRFVLHQIAHVRDPEPNLKTHNTLGKALCSRFILSYTLLTSLLSKYVPISFENNSS